MVLQCIVQYKRRHTLYSRTDSIAGRGSVANQSARIIHWRSLTLFHSLGVIADDPGNLAYSDLCFLIFPQISAEFSKANFISSCKIIQFIKSYKFPSISQNN